MAQTEGLVVRLDNQRTHSKETTPWLQFRIPNLLLKQIILMIRTGYMTRNCKWIKKYPEDNFDHTLAVDMNDPFCRLETIRKQRTC